MRLQRQFEEAIRRQQRGDHVAAVTLYRGMLEEDLPPEAEHAIRINLGKALRQAGQPQEAATCALAATHLVPEDEEAWGELGLALAAAGQPEVAVEAQRTGLALQPTVAGWVNLGNALRASGDRAGAIEAFEQALDLDENAASVFFNLAAAVHRDDAPEEALELLARCLDLAPRHTWALFLDHAIARWGGVEEPAPPVPDFLLSSLAFALEERGDATRLFADTFTTLGWASERLVDGIVVELGVRHGTSLRFLAKRLPTRRLVGFDSFEGLPVAWGDQAPGLYSTQGRRPAVPSHVELVGGWFRDTVPPFAAELGEPIALLHVDCDVYDSTREGLQLLAEHLAPGALLVFDDYLANPGWEGDEHRALCETLEDTGASVEYLAFSFFSRQAVVRWCG